MSGNVRIEVRPAFDETVRTAERPLRQAAAKALRLLQSLDLRNLWKHRGLNFEKLHGLSDPTTGEQLYSLRVTRSARAIAVLRTGPTIVLVTPHVQHGEAYRKK